MNISYRKISLLFASILLLWLSGCIDLPTNLKVPQWNVDLNLPLVNKSYTLNDIIKKQPYVSIGADSVYILQSNTYTHGANVSNFLQLNAQTSTPPALIPVVNNDTQTVYVPIPKGAILENAVFTSGSLSFNISNLNVQAVNILIIVPGIIQNGSALKIPMNVQALQQNYTNSTSLAGCQYIQPANQSAQNQSSIQLIVSFSTSLPLGSFLTMQFSCSNFDFSSVTGYLPELSLGVQSQSFSLNLGSAENYRDKVSLKYDSLNMDVNYQSFLPGSSPFPIQIKNLSIIGEREDGSTMPLSYDSTQNNYISIYIPNGNKHLSFTQDNSNLSQFLTFLPNTVIVTAEYIMNPYNSTTMGSATGNDTVYFSTNFSTKSILALQSTLMTDTTSINISSQDSVDIQNAKSAYVNINVQNGIPLNASLTVKFVDANYNFLFSDSLSFLAANINTTTGAVTSPVTTPSSITLDSAQASKLSGAHYAITTVTLNTNGASNNPPQDVVVSANDVLQVTVYGGVNYHVNTNQLK
jgi:hypothetical protein